MQQSFSDKYDVVIIGAGLGGLECGYILQKHGKKVCVLEKDPLIGGCLQTFRRNGQGLDTGFHYVGGLDKGQMLWRLFSYFKLIDLPWVKMDEDCFDEVVIKGKHYKFAQGYDNFKKTMTEAFPHQEKEIASFVELLRKVGDNTDKSFDARDTEDFYTQSLFAQSAYEYLCETISDKELIDVLSGTALKMELNAEKLPLYTFAQICSSFVQSAYRLKNGGMQIAESLRKSIEEMGGHVFRNSEVTGIVANDGQIGAVVVNGKTEVRGEVYISDIHPAATMNLLGDSKLIRNIYRKRINGLENTCGMFTTHLVLKKGCVKYLNRNIYAYSTDDIWHLKQNASEGDIKEVLISIQPPSDDSEYTSNIDVLTPMNWCEVERWFGTKIGERGVDYDRMKEMVAEKCISIASEYIPCLKDSIEFVYTSTPLTYNDYTATVQGSAYGIRKNYNELMFTVLTPRTPVKNLLLTGQSLNLHGILGVSMTSVFTCAEVLGMDVVVNDLKSI